MSSSPRRRRTVRFGLALLLSLLMAPPALAVDPNVVMGGANSRWFSGSWLSQSGTNCSILGGAYSETMVSGIASYGGLPSIPTAGTGYYTSLLLSVPGNPCGSGSTAISTDVLLPPGTTIDTTRPIRCFGQGRTATTFSEITNEGWSHLGHSGRYCPTAAAPSALHGGAWNLGFRPLANGQLFQIFVPVKSSQALNGAGASPAHEFRWLTDATGVFSNPGQSYVWTNVLPAGPTSGPFVYFERDAAVPFWKADAPAGPPDTRNRVELWANVYTAGLAGNLCFEIRRVSDNSLRATCNSVGGWNGAVGAGQGIVQILPTGAAVGPNGGYAPIYFDPPGFTPSGPEWDQDMVITWTFDPDSGPAVSKSATFHTLPGPDTDLDGVADIRDACPATKGTLSNGCQPAALPDGDADGVYGAADLCPSVDGRGALNGCPEGDVTAEPTPTGPQTTTTTSTAAVPTTTAPQTTVGATLTGSPATKRGAKLARKTLLAGTKIKVTCSRDASAGLALSVDDKVAKKLKLKAKKGASLVLASGKGACKASGGGSIKLAVASKYRAALKRAKGTVAATLTLRLDGAPAAGVPVKLG